VLDEVHAYKGIFGSHISQVLLRLRRVCNYYGSSPNIFASSATIGNPGDFVSRLVGEDIDVVDQSGAASPQRHFVFLQPALSPYTIAARLFVSGIKLGLKTIVFTRARKLTELITSWVLREAPELRSRVSSYRAGFLPEERRDIEARLFSGRMDGVISTSALEMGIDVGGLDLCLLVGYPGTIMNTWQRGGRVGRAGRPSAIVLIAGHDALDQYFIKNPEDFFERGVENAVLDPLNVEVLKKHLPCAAAETPIEPCEEWAGQPKVQAVLDELESDGVLYRDQRTGNIHSSRRRPHRGVELRGIGESFSIFLDDGKTLIGSNSGVRVLSECHEGAVYLHRARQYEVTKLDLARRNILVAPARLNYYTRGLSDKTTEILGAPTATREFPGFIVREGRLKVTETITAYEKRRSSGQELVGVVALDLPPVHFETVGFWIEIPESVRNAVKKEELDFMGGIHALEHAAIAMFPLFALCDRDDIGGISTPNHEQVCRAAVFIYDGHPGGVGLAHHVFGCIEELLEKTRKMVQSCRCEDGCPSCIHSPKCGSGNKPLDKTACLMALDYLLEPEKAHAFYRKKPAARTPPSAIPSAKTAAQAARPPRCAPLIFPDLKGTNMASPVNAMDIDTMSTAAASQPRPLGDRVFAPAEPSKRRARTKGGSGKSEAGAAGEHADKLAPRIVVFDLETRKLADEVGGWRNVAKMGLSLGVAYTEERGFQTFTEDNVSELVRLIKSADLVIGFNQITFDYEVLSAYSSENLRALPNLDILAEVARELGFRLKLEDLANSTLGKKKSGHGVEAVNWFREGRIDLLEQYCRDDVEITRDLYYFGLENGYLRYKNKRGQTAKIPVKWEGLGKQRSTEARAG
jgi:DEAD/DEAH box helicase domain-containing protein